MRSNLRLAARIHRKPVLDLGPPEGTVSKVLERLDAMSEAPAYMPCHIICKGLTERHIDALRQARFDEVFEKYDRVLIIYDDAAVDHKFRTAKEDIGAYKKLFGAIYNCIVREMSQMGLRYTLSDLDWTDWKDCLPETVSQGLGKDVHLATKKYAKGNTKRWIKESWYDLIYWRYQEPSSEALLQIDLFVDHLEVKYVSPGDKLASQKVRIELPQSVGDSGTTEGSISIPFEDIMRRPEKGTGETAFVLNADILGCLANIHYNGAPTTGDAWRTTYSQYYKRLTILDGSKRPGI